MKHINLFSQDAPIVQICTWNINSFVLFNCSVKESTTSLIKELCYMNVLPDIHITFVFCTNKKAAITRFNVNFIIWKQQEMSSHKFKTRVLNKETLIPMILILWEAFKIFQNFIWFNKMLLFEIT